MKFSPSAGYRRLDSWVLASIAQFATYRFCEKFLTKSYDPTGRQYDQMTQLATPWYFQLSFSRGRE